VGEGIEVEKADYAQEVGKLVGELDAVGMKDE
jgi:hypothetical protein